MRAGRPTTRRSASWRPPASTSTARPPSSPASSRRAHGCSTRAAGPAGWPSSWPGAATTWSGSTATPRCWRSRAAAPRTSVARRRPGRAGPRRALRPRRGRRQRRGLPRRGHRAARSSGGWRAHLRPGGLLVSGWRTDRMSARTYDELADGAGLEPVAALEHLGPRALARRRRLVRRRAPRRPHAAWRHRLGRRGRAGPSDRSTSARPAGAAVGGARVRGGRGTSGRRS